jgi:hypothetical protein
MIIMRLDSDLKPACWGRSPARMGDADAEPYGRSPGSPNTDGVMATVAGWRRG